MVALGKSDDERFDSLDDDDMGVGAGALPTPGTTEKFGTRAPPLPSGLY